MSDISAHWELLWNSLATFTSSLHLRLTLESLSLSFWHLYHEHLYQSYLHWCNSNETIAPINQSDLQCNWNFSSLWLLKTAYILKAVLLFVSFTSVKRLDNESVSWTGFWIQVKICRGNSNTQRWRPILVPRWICVGNQFTHRKSSETRYYTS